MYTVTKTFPHSLGLSTVYRQWRADSHCRLLHGYALSFEVTFSASSLNEQGWVVDFGDLKELKDYLVQRYDHTLLIERSDPMIDILTALGRDGLANIHIVDQIGCEAFARDFFAQAFRWVAKSKHDGRVRVDSARAIEHEGNKAAYVLNI
jgi:6-pyruvoyltetrahydropterin/6-carboxytetrahydropterin synthase